MATTARLTAGVDLGGTKIQTVVLRSGKVVGQSRRTHAAVRAGRATSSRPSPAPCGSRSPRPESRGRSVASASARLARSTQAAGVVSLAANVPGFSGRVSLGPRLSKALDGIEVVIDNDVRVAVRGEHVARCRPPISEHAGSLGRHRCRRWPRRRWRAARWSWRRGRDRPPRGPAGRSSMRLWAPWLPGGLCRAGAAGSTGASPGQEGPADGPLRHHEEARARSAQLRRVRACPQEGRPHDETSSSRTQLGRSASPWRQHRTCSTWRPSSWVAAWVTDSASPSSTPSSPR